MNPLTSTVAYSLHEIHSLSSTSPSSFVGGGKILVVDDDEDTRILHRRLLSGAGYASEEAADGEEAWNRIMTNSYDLVLTDYNMPRLSGLDLVARLRAANMTLPVIIFSGSPELGDVSDHPYLHLSAILQKSCEYRNILDAVKRVLPLPQGEQHEATLDSPEAAELRNHSARAQFGRRAKGSTI